MNAKKHQTYDKCQICNYIAKSQKFGKPEKPKCPICGSTDINDVSYNPYNDD